MNIPDGATHTYHGKIGIDTFLRKDGDDWLSLTVGEWEKLGLSYQSHLYNNPQLIQPIEDVDNVNQPTHYTQGKVECIDAIESATVGKSGIEAVCVGNVIKYLWRYEQKGGKESVEKAQYYLNKLLEKMK